VIDKPLYGNPLSGGSLDMGKYIGNPNFPEPELKGNFGPKSDDPLMQGYYDSDFFSNIMTMDMVPYTFQGKDMMGSSSGASNLKKYLESIGKGDLLQFKNNNIMSTELEKVNPPAVNPIVEGNDLMESPDNNAMIPGNPGAFTPPVLENVIPESLSPNMPGAESIFTGNATLPDNISDNFLGDGIFNSPSETTGQYLTGPNESANVLETLKNIEQGIASLGQGNMNQSSFGGFNNNFGIGSFFPPYGGMYG
jgi:hypothetical protein